MWLLGHPHGALGSATLSVAGPPGALGGFPASDVALQRRFLAGGTEPGSAGIGGLCPLGSAASSLITRRPPIPKSSLVPECACAAFISSPSSPPLLCRRHLSLQPQLPASCSGKPSRPCSVALGALGRPASCHVERVLALAECQAGAAHMLPWQPLQQLCSADFTQMSQIQEVGLECSPVPEDLGALLGSPRLGDRPEWFPPGLRLTTHLALPLAVVRARGPDLRFLQWPTCHPGTGLGP